MFIIKFVIISILLELCVVIAPSTPDIHQNSPSSPTSNDSFKKTGELLIDLNSKEMYREMFKVQNLNEESLKTKYHKVFLIISSWRLNTILIKTLKIKYLVNQFLKVFLY